MRKGILGFVLFGKVFDVEGTGGVEDGDDHDADVGEDGRPHAGDAQRADVLAACREKGLLVLTAKTRLRLLPPLTLTAHDVDMALEILGEVLTGMQPKTVEEKA